VGDLVVKRLEATRKLQENPNDFTAQQTLAYIEQKVIQSTVDYFLHCRKPATVQLYPPQ